MLNAIIVDDEAPARSELRFLLGEIGGVEVVAEAASVREAIEKMQVNPVDVLFLDVSMPEITGIQFADALQRLKNPPAVVFVTAYSEHALEGFKVHAVDYLVKPVETDRLRQAVSRASEHVLLHAKASHAERIVWMLDNATVVRPGLHDDLLVLWRHLVLVVDIPVQRNQQLVDELRLAVRLKILLRLVVPEVLPEHVD